MARVATQPEHSVLKTSCNSETATGYRPHGTSTPETWAQGPQLQDR